MLVWWAVKPIARERPVRVADGRGGLQDDWTTPNSLELEGAVAPGASLEDLQNRDGSLVQYTVYFAGQPDVKAGDRMLYQGEHYAVDGHPAEWPSFDGVGYLVVLLKRWEG